jgi:hypothetical protein
MEFGNLITCTRFRGLMLDMVVMLHMDHPSSQRLFHSNPHMVAMDKDTRLRYGGSPWCRYCLEMWKAFYACCMGVLECSKFFLID